MSASGENLDFCVTTIFDILDKNVSELQKSLDYQLKSDNWACVSEKNNIYVKNNYLFSGSDDFDVIVKEFMQDIQEIFSISAKNLAKNCSSAKPFAGFAQIGNFGHVEFTVKFNKKSEEFTVSCKIFNGYNSGINTSYCDNLFS